MNLENKLQHKYLNDIDITINDLYPYSKIKLNRKRQRKKFNKFFINNGYVSKECIEAYCHFGYKQSSKRLLLTMLLITKPIPKITPNSVSKVTIAYLDYTYNDQNGK